MPGEVDAKVQEEKYAPRTFMKYSSEDMGRDTPGETILMNCNEAIARGAIEAGVRVITSYPGSPVNYVLDSLAAARQLYPSMHIEWSANEKSAYETVVGATRGNVRGMAVFKNVGMNFIVDPLLASTHLGVSGAVVVFNDDPNAETTGNTQDSRFIPRYALCPILEPATMQEVKDWIVDAYDLSEQLRMTVFVRVRDRTGWGREPVILGKIQHAVRERKAHCDPTDAMNFRRGYSIPHPEHQVAPRVAPYPIWFSTSLRLHNQAPEQVLKEVGLLPNLKARDEAVESFPHNELTLRKGAKVGIITAGCHTLVLEALDILEMSNEVSVLKLATSYPLPKHLVRKILENTETVLVVEEIEPLIEEGVRSIAAEMDKHAKIMGKLTHHIPTLFEVERNTVGEALAKITGKKFQPRGSKTMVEEGKRILLEDLKFGDPSELSKMCPGCPEYAGLYALKRTAEELGIDIVGFGGDGCFDLVGQPPLRLESTALPLGGSVGGAHGLAISGVDKVVVALMGDGGFFHHGMVNVVNAVYNKSNLLIAFLDNRSVGQTGHQPHPGAFGLTAAYEPTKILDMVDILKAFQVDFVEVVDPYDQKQCRDTFERALRMKGIRAVVIRRTCAQIAVRQIGKTTARGVRIIGPQSRVDTERCLASVVEQAPCEAACPAGIDVEAYVKALADGDFRKALRIIREKNPFAGVCGRVCNHPCEQNCKRAKVDEAVDIMGLKRFASDFEFGSDMEKPKLVKKTRPEKVAVIGSGPAGLTAAHDLVNKGYGVTVFEARPVVGGMLTMALPDFVLPRHIVERDIDYIKSFGVEIKTGVTLGKDITINDLFEQGYKAILLAVGAQKGLNLKIPGSDLDGIYTALSLLQNIKRGKNISLSGKVVIIGGGNVAIDAARAAVRLGAKEVHLACLESSHDMPAFEWEITKAIEEGVIMHPALAPQEFISSNGKKVTAVRFKRVASISIDSEGRLSWTLMEGPGSEIAIDADRVIVAIGQAPDLAGLSDGQVKLTKRGTFKIDEVTLATNLPGVFAGGDAVTGPATVVEAVAAGHRGAESIDRYLKGQDIMEGRVAARPPITGADRLPRDIRYRRRMPMPKVPPQRRIGSFGEAELGFTEDMAISEAKRCLNCKTCSLCIEKFGCVSLTPQQNENLAKEYPQVELDTCAGCGVCNQVCPFDSITTIIE